MPDTFVSAGEAATAALKTIIDPHHWWREALEGRFGPIHEGEPQTGFYKTRYKAQPWEPVAIWRDGATGEWCALRSGKEVDAAHLWTYACKNPISYELYQAVAARGEPWPEDILSRSDDPEVPAADRFVTLSHNAPPEGYESLKADVEELKREAERQIKAGEVSSQEDADRLSNLATRLGEFEKQADDLRKKEKKPHDDAGKAVQVKWLPVVEDAKVAKERLKAHVSRWLNAELERKRQKAAADIAAGADPIALDIKVKAGTRGKTVALRTVKTAKLTDYRKTLDHFAEHPEVKDLVQRLANAAARSGIAVPGAEIITEQKAA